jgi:hypothetical protein
MTYKTMCSSPTILPKSFELWITTADTDYRPQISVIDTVDEPINEHVTVTTLDDLWFQRPVEESCQIAVIVMQGDKRL